MRFCIGLRLDSIFDIPAHEWFRGVLRPFLLDTLSHQALKGNVLFMPWAVNQVIAENLNKETNRGITCGAFWP